MDYTTPKKPYLLIAMAVAICVILPLVVSSQQAGQFFRSLGTGTDSTILFLAACAIIFSSPMIAVLLGHAAKDWHKVMAVCVCSGIIFFSITTTTIAINTKTGAKIESENQSSAASQAMQSSINSNIAAVQSLQAQIDARDPSRWAGQRAKWASQIQMHQMQNMQLMREQRDHAKSGSGSVTAETFARLEEYGITRFGFAVFAATLLDLIPFVVCLIIGGILASRFNASRYSVNEHWDDSGSGRGDYGKKYQPREAA